MSYAVRQVLAAHTGQYGMPARYLMKRSGPVPNAHTQGMLLGDGYGNREHAQQVITSPCYVCELSG